MRLYVTNNKSVEEGNIVQDANGEFFVYESQEYRHIGNYSSDDTPDPKKKPDGYITVFKPAIRTK